MAWDPEFLELMPTTVNLIPPGERTLYGQIQAETEQPVRCRIKPDQHLIVSRDGEEVMALGYMWCPPPGAVASPDVDGDETPVPVGPLTMVTTSWMAVIDGDTQRIISVEQQFDEDGLHHLKLHWGR